MNRSVSRFVAGCLFALAAGSGLSALAGTAIPTVTIATSPNPSRNGESVTITVTVTGDAGTATGTVGMLVGNLGNVPCRSIALVGGSATCTVSELGVGTQSLAVLYSGDAIYNIGGAGSTHLVNAVPPANANVALASSGAVATASSSLGGYPVARVNDGDRSGQGNGFWADGTPGVFPDAVEIAFGGTKTIDRVFVHSVQDDVSHPVDPSDVQPFTLYGLTDFAVEGWNGSAWENLGLVLGNTLVKRSVGFAPFSTDRIRVVVLGARDGYARIAEIEAFTAGAAPALGTPTVTLASAHNPIAAGQDATFTVSISGSQGKPTGSVALFDGSTPIAGCASIPLVAGGLPYLQTVTCATAALASGTHAIVALYSGDPAFVRGFSAPLTQVVNNAPPPAGTNVALAANGGIASATTTLGGLSVAAVNNGERTGAGGNFWADSTPGAFPDTVTIQFNGPKSIDRVVVHSVQDAFMSPVEPTDATTFALYGLKAFTVEGWNGSGWVTLGAVTGNNLVKRTVSFAAFATDRIRVNVTGAGDAYSRIVEIEALATGSALGNASVTLTSAQNPTLTGRMTSLTAVVTGSTGLPTGTVSFFDGGSPIPGCTSTTRLSFSGGASNYGCGSNTLSAATHAITAVYSGDAYHASATSNVVNQVVEASVPVAPTVTIGSSLNPSSHDRRILLFASISGAVGVFPSGTVTFLDGTVPIPGCEAVTISVIASCTTSTLGVGVHAIVATYSGNLIYLPGTSGPFTQVVNEAPPGGVNVALETNGGLASATSTYGGKIAAMANNDSRTGANGNFWADGTPGEFPDAVTIAFDGVKTIDRVVIYSVQDSLSNPVEPTDATTFTLYGLKAFTVEGWNGSGWVTLGTVAGNSLVKRTVGFAPFGTDRIRVTVTAAGDAYARIVEIEAFTPGGPPVAAPVIALASSLNPSSPGQPVTLTATASGDSGTPDGSVTFFDGGNRLLECGTANLNAGTASCSLSTLALGTHAITAIYAGNATYASGISNTLAQVIRTPALVPTLSLASYPNPSLLGAPVELTVTVSGGGATPGGSVSFFDGGNALAACGTRVVNSGMAYCAVSSLAQGAHAITATYSGDTTYAGGTTGQIVHTVSAPPVAPTVVLSSSPNPSTLGQAVAFTATIVGGAGTATGTVSFRENGGLVGGCTNPAPLVSGVATCATGALSVATHPIVANYSGDAAYTSGTSNAVSQVVDPRPPDPRNVAAAANGGVATASSSYPCCDVSYVNDNERSGVRPGIGLTYWADSTPGLFPDTVTIAFNGLKTIDRVVVYTVQDYTYLATEPTDTMTFANGGVTGFTVEAWNGSAWVNLGTVTGNNLVKRTVNFPASTTNRIRVNVTGAGDAYSRLVEIEAFAVTLGSAPATVSLASSPNPSTGGQEVTLTATVSGGSGAPGGHVNFLDGASPIAGCSGVVLAAGIAGCTTAGLSVGTHSLVASYSGDSVYASTTSDALGQVVNPGADVATNVALASRGAVATASSTYAGASVVPVNDDERTGAGGNFWADATPGAFPDTVKIDFNGMQTIDRVVVYSVQDAYLNPVEPTGAATFSLYGLTGFSVAGWMDGSWVNLGSVTGNNLVKRTLSFPAFATDRILVSVAGARDAHSRIAEIEAWTPGSAPPPSTNFALASNGGVASATSTLSGLSVAPVNNGERSGAGTGFWADRTPGTFPDTVTIQFNGTRTLDRVVVYSVQDAYTSPVEPTDSTTFSLYGLTTFNVEGWNGSSWVSLGTVTGNSFVKRTVSFAGFTTDRIRVNVLGASDPYSRIVEIEAWGN